MTSPRADEDWVVAYVAGELSVAEELEFEARVAAEPALAELLDRCQQVELLGAVAARARPVVAGAGSRRAGLPALLLCAVLACALGCVWWWLRGDAAACTMRVVATAATEPMAYAVSLGLPEDVGVDGEERRSAAAARRILPAAEFLAQVAAAEALRDATLFAAPQQRVAATFATVRFTSREPCAAVVLLAGAGRMQRVYPPPSGEFVFAAAPNRFAAGPVHVLPRPVLVANTIGGLSLHAGFDLGGAGAGTLVLALRAELPEHLLASLDAVVAAGDGAALRRWLREHGFVVQEAPVGTG